MQPTNLSQHIEALIYSSAQGITVEEIIQAVNAVFNEEYSEEFILKQLESIRQRYSSEENILELTFISGGYQFLTKKEYHETINQLQNFRSKKKLSQAALETLAIIAYRQPVTKLEIEQIRGVNSDYSVQRLLEKDLITIEGKAETVGRPILYQTSHNFMDYFGLKTLKNLPRLKDFAKADNFIGSEAE